MPIPPFDGNLVIPPHLGNPAALGQLSPYPCSSVEVCERFSSSPERIVILEGWLAHRGVLRNQPGLVGFQWVGGSFMEDVEARESRPPNDIDVVTCHGQMDAAQLQAIVDNQHVNARDFVKQTYHVDHFLFDICHSPEFTVYFTQYWTGLFTHRRDGIWKGLLRVELDTPADDAVAYDHLRAAKANPR